jgi:hypothetical protein
MMAASSFSTRPRLAGTQPGPAGETRAVTHSQAGLGGAVATRGRHSACSSSRDRGAPASAHASAPRCTPSASCSWGGRSRRASAGGTVRARLAVIATRRWRLTPGPPGACPSPAAAEKGGHVMWADGTAGARLVVLATRRWLHTHRLLVWAVWRQFLESDPLQLTQQQIR